MKTSNPEAMLIAFAGLLQSLAVVLTLGFWRPPWEFGVVIWLMRRKFGDE